ncbi:MAG: mechanosensitive ion channel family protein [Phycisphaerales bacterium]
MLESLPEWAVCLVAVGVAVAIAVAVVLVVYWVLARLTSDEGESQTRHLVRKTRWPARLLAVTLGAGLGVGLCGPEGGLPAEFLDAWPDIQRVMLILSATWLVIGLLAGADDMLLARYRTDVRDNLKARRVHTQVRVITRMLMVIVGIVGIALALMTFDDVREIGASMLASAGIAGIVIGFAARPVLGNIIAGIQIALTQPIRLDDVVIIEGEWGRIEEITTTYVVVKIWDERRLIVPFSRIIEEPFQNWTRQTSEILGTVFIHADYTVPVDAVRDELKRVCEGHDLWDGRVCGLVVTEAGESSVTIRALVSAEDASKAWDLRCDVRERLIDFLQREHPGCLPRTREIEYREDARGG